MAKTGCMSCSGEVCGKCRFWQADANPLSKWGVCDYFTANPGAPRRMYAGNIKGLLDGETVQTTSTGKCRNFEGRG